MFAPVSVFVFGQFLYVWRTCFRSAQYWLKLGYLFNVLSPITLREDATGRRIFISPIAKTILQ